MIIKFIGECSINFFKALKYIFSGRVNTKNLLTQSSVIGVDSLGIALVIATVSGSILALQVSKQFALSGAERYVGGLLSLALVREMAPIFAALSIGARAGTGIAAEIANMRVTEQIDAMNTLKVDPIAYLLVPRLMAGALMVPLVTLLAELLGILGGMVVAQSAIDLHPARYLTSVWLFLEPFDIYVSLIKALVFGVLITLICSTHGLLTRGGAKEVGMATTKAAIWTSLSILIFDYLITWAFYS